jgi:tRNA A-37 threonylcarbamoyl transferase component Bud32
MDIPNGNAHKPSAFAAFSDRGIHWIADPSCRHLIPRALEALLHPGASGACFMLRENPVRRSMIIRLPGAGEAIFAKLYKRPAAAERFKYLIVPSRASSEWSSILSFYKRGLPVAGPLARGERRKSGFLEEAYLFTRALEGAVPLNEILSRPDTFKQQTMLIEPTARVVAKMHTDGFFFRDLHAGNILIVPVADAPGPIYLVDLHKVWHTGWVPLWMRARDLAQLRNSLSVSRTVRLRFLRSYLRHAGLPADSLRQAARRIDRTAGRMWRTHLRSRTKRCLTESSEFSISARGASTIYRNRMYPEPLIAALLDRYQQTGRDNPLILKKTAKETVSVISLTQDGKACTVVIKEARFASLFSRLRNTLFSSRARRNWIGARALRVRGVATPDALALLECRGGLLLGRTILITRYVDRSQELNDYVLLRYNRALSEEETRHKKRFIAALARVIRDMHNKGIYHADLKSNNILVCEEADSWRLYVVDLDRLRCDRRLSFEERAVNLAQMNASVAACITPADRILFFRHYAQGTPLAKEGKRYFRRIMDIGRKKNTGPYGLVFKQS